MDADFRYNLETNKVIFQRQISRKEFNEYSTLANKYKLQNNEQYQKLRNVLRTISPQPNYYGDKIEIFTINDNIIVTLIRKPLQQHEYLLNDIKFPFKSQPGIHRFLRKIYIANWMVKEYENNYDKFNADALLNELSI